MKKKLLLAVLTLALLVGVFAAMTIGASAATSGNYTYTIQDGKAIITDVNTAISGKVIVPATLGGYPVTKIGEKAFADCDKMTAISFGNNITYVGQWAFQSCSNLTTVALSENLKTINTGAFLDCDKLKSIVIPDSVTTLSADAFRRCYSLSNVVFGSGLVQIHKYAFAGCRSLTTVKLPIYVERIEDYAFENCTGLKTVHLPKSLKVVKVNGFNNCKNIQNVYYQGTSTQWKSIEFQKNNIRLTGATINYKKFEWPLKTLKKVNGVWKYYIDNVFAPQTTLVKFNGEWFYVKEGIKDSSCTGFVPFNGATYYMVNGKVASKTTNLIKYNGEWWYVVKGQLASKTTSLIKFNGSWWYVVNGKVASKTTSLVKYNGEWWYVVKGQIASNTTTLVKYNGSWYYIVKGKMAGNTTGFVTYNGTKYYVKKGVMQSTLSGKVTVNGRAYFIKNGALTNCHSAGHSFAAATCMKPKTCTKCTITQGGTASHTYSRGKCQYCQKLASAKDYAYLAGNDFRRIDREYHGVPEAQAAYVVIFTDRNGDVCVLTHVRYKMIDTFSETTLHNLTQGWTQTDPVYYYNQLSNRYYGGTKLAYMELESEVRGKEITAMRGISDVLSTGTHSGAGAYVDAATLNK